MPIVDETTCLNKLPEDKRGLLEFITIWVSVREFYRAKDSDVPWVDQTFANAWVLYQQTEKDDLTQILPANAIVFAQMIEEMLSGIPSAQGSLVGWDNEECKMSWRKFACVCSYLARMTPNAAVQAAADLQAGKAPTWSCPDAVLNDIVYDCDWPMPIQDCQDPWTWKQWIVPVGIAVVGGGLLWWLFGAKARMNPARKSSHFMVKMSNTEEDGVLLIVQGPGAAKWAKQYKQSAAGSSWESDGPDFAYTIVSDYPGLVKDLKLERYNLDQSEYTPAGDQ